MPQAVEQERSGKGRYAVSAHELAYYRASFREALREDGVVCLECGGIYKVLGPHVLKHDLTLQDYREKWGYDRQTPFTAPETQQKMRRHALARNLRALAPPDSLSKAWEARRSLPARSESRLAHREELRARYAAGWQPPRRRKATEETLRTLVAEGLTAREIAARAGLTPGRVRRRLRSLGLTAVVLPRQKAGDEVLLALRRAGLWASEIAVQVGMSTSRVNRRLRELQGCGEAVPPPTRPRPIPWRRVSDQQLVTLARAGLRPRAISARVGIARQVVAKRLGGLRQRGLLPAVSP